MGEVVPLHDPPFPTMGQPELHVRYFGIAGYSGVYLWDIPFQFLEVQGWSGAPPGAPDKKPASLAARLLVGPVS